MELGQTSPKGDGNNTSVQLEDIDDENLGAYPKKISGKDTVDEDDEVVDGKRYS